jgi:P4 family phage/plasmid primase-like protien
MYNPFSMSVHYIEAGWEGTLPLPYKEKKFPPKGFTGKGGTMPTSQDLSKWGERQSNICLRLPKNVIGIDVDNYEDKQGLRTLQEHEAKWGELPPTWTSTARAGGSGIRLYRVPDDRMYLTQLKRTGAAESDIEIIQFGHRYVVTHPSLHPEGPTYKWYDPEGNCTTEGDEIEIPTVDELPELPLKWVDGLTKKVGEYQDWRTASAGVDVTPGDDFCLRAEWSDILEPHGFKLLRVDQDGEHYWQRPGKGPASDDNSVTTHKYKSDQGFDLLHCFTSSTVFEIDETYNKFAAYKILNYGDGSEGWRQATLDLVEKGYGKRHVNPDLKNYFGTDTDNAELFVKWHGSEFRYVPEKGKWFWWNGKTWDPNGNARAIRCAQQMGNRIIDGSKGEQDSQKATKLFKAGLAMRNTSGYTGCLSAAQSMLGKSASEFDADTHLVNVTNGTLDLSARDPRDVLRGHQQNDLLTYKTNWRYNPDAQCPIWENFLRHALRGDMEMYRYVQKVVGYMLSGDTSDKSLFFVWGPPNSGKTRFVEQLKVIFGSDYGVTLMDDALVMKPKMGGNDNSISALRGKRFATMSELPEGYRINGNLVKQITSGGGTITTMRKYEQEVTFTVQAKILIDTNFRPAVLQDDQALWNRVRLIPFDVVIPEEEQDKQLEQKLVGESEGILAWAVRGWFMYKKEGLPVPGKMTEAVKDYRDREDWFATFLEDCCDVGTDLMAPAGQLYSVYQEWAQTNGEKVILSNRLFGDQLSKRGYEVVKKTTRYRKGLSIRPRVIIGAAKQEDAA